MNNRSSCELDIHRASSVRKILKPDFYQFWPRFTDSELKQRMTWCDISSATLLTEQNLDRMILIDQDRAASFFQGLVASGADKQWCHVARILRNLHFSGKVIEAIYRSERKSYFPEHLRPFFPLNHSFQILGDTNITLYGLTALLLERLKDVRPSRVIEIGAGTGYQLNLMSNFFGVQNSIGFEPNAEALKEMLGANIRGQRHYAVEPDFFSFKDFTAKENDLFVFSCSLSENPHGLIDDLVRSTRCFAVYAAPVSPALFNSLLKGKIKSGSMRISSEREYSKFPRSYQALFFVSSNGRKISRRPFLFNAGYVEFRRKEQGAKIDREDPFISKINGLIS